MGLTDAEREAMYQLQGQISHLRDERKGMVDSVAYNRLTLRIAKLRSKHMNLWLVSQGINPTRTVVSLSEMECQIVKRYFETLAKED